MRVSFEEMLADARAAGAAVGAFTCYNLETAAGVLAAAEEAEVPVVLLAAAKTFVGAAGPLLMRSLIAAADAARVPALVQLDHVNDLAVIESAVTLGAGAVMADGSMFDLEENAAICKRAAETVRPYGAAIEVELGHIEGDEDVARAIEAGALTDPADARLLVESTGAVCLAVSIGNVHGHYAHPPKLDWERLDEIREVVPAALSLHGASGLEEATLREAIRRGVSKINVNTELRTAYLVATSAQLGAVEAGADVARLNRAQTQAVADAVRTKLVLLRGGDL